MTRKPLFHITQDRFERDQEAYRQILSERQYRIIYARFIQQQTYQVIAKQEGVSTTRIQQIVAKACYVLHKNRYQTDGTETFE